MFYSSQILARKGPLGVVWIAAHVDGQLKRSQIFDMSIPGTVEALLSQEAPLALRLTGQLMLGVVRIYARKVKYLHQDCNDALAKIRVAFHTSQLELTLDNTTAPAAAITLADHAIDDIALLLGQDSGGWQYGSGPAYSSGAGGVLMAASGGAGLTGTIEVEFDVLGLGSQGDMLLRQASVGQALRPSALLPGLGSQHNGGLGGGLSRRQSLMPQCQPVLEEEEMFEEAPEDFLHDLDDIEVEHLRAAASVQGPDRGAGDILAGLGGTLSGASGKLQAPSVGGGTPQDGGGRALSGRAAGSASLGSPEEADRPVGLMTVGARRLPMGAGAGQEADAPTPGESSGAEGGLGLTMDMWAPGSTTHQPQRQPHGPTASGSQPGGEALDADALLPLDRAASVSQKGPGGTPLDLLLPDGSLGCSPLEHLLNGVDAMDVDAAGGVPEEAAPGVVGGQAAPVSAVDALPAGDSRQGSLQQGPGEDQGQGQQPEAEAEGPEQGHRAGQSTGQEQQEEQQPRRQRRQGMATRRSTAAATPAVTGGAAAAAALTPMTIAPPAAQPAAVAGQARPPLPRARAAAQAKVLRRPAKVDPGGSAGTQLKASDMRALLNNRASLLGHRRQVWQEQQQQRRQQRSTSAAAACILSNGLLTATAADGGACPAAAMQLCQPLALLVQAATGKLAAGPALEAATGSYLVGGAGSYLAGHASVAASPAALAPALLAALAAARPSPSPGAPGLRRSGRLGPGAPLDAAADAGAHANPGQAVDAPAPGSVQPLATTTPAVMSEAGGEGGEAPWFYPGADTGGGASHGAPLSQRLSQPAFAAGDGLGGSGWVGFGHAEGGTGHQGQDNNVPVAVDVVYGTQVTERGDGSILAPHDQRQGQDQNMEDQGGSSKENQPPLAPSDLGSQGLGKGLGQALSPLRDVGNSPLRKRQRCAEGSGAAAAAVGVLGRSPLQALEQPLCGVGAGGATLAAAVRAASSSQVSGGSRGTPGPGSQAAAAGSQQAAASLDEELMQPGTTLLDWGGLPSQDPEQGYEQEGEEHGLGGQREGQEGGLGQHQGGDQGAGADLEGLAGHPAGTPHRSSTARAAAGQGTPGSAVAGRMAAAGLSPAPLNSGVGVSPGPGALMGAPGASPGSSMGLGLASANKGAPRRSFADTLGEPGLLYTSGSGEDPATDGSGDLDGSARSLTQAAGSVLHRVAYAALAKLPAGFGSLALSQADEGCLSQEAATQLTQTRLSMEQLTQGISRIQACRWFSELLLLQNRGLVQLQQEQAYTDVEIALTQPGVAATSSQMVAAIMSQSQQ